MTDSPKETKEEPTLFDLLSKVEKNRDKLVKISSSPSRKYSLENAAIVYELAHKGMTRAQMCRHFNISTSLFSAWCEKYQEFRDAWEYAQTIIEANIEDDLQNVMIQRDPTVPLPEVNTKVLELYAKANSRKYRNSENASAEILPANERVIESLSKLLDGITVQTTTTIDKKSPKIIEHIDPDHDIIEIDPHTNNENNG